MSRCKEEKKSYRAQSHPPLRQPHPQDREELQLKVGSQDRVWREYLRLQELLLRLLASQLRRGGIYLSERQKYRK